MYLARTLFHGRRGQAAPPLTRADVRSLLSQTLGGESHPALLYEALHQVLCQVETNVEFWPLLISIAVQPEIGGNTDLGIIGSYSLQLGSEPTPINYRDAAKALLRLASTEEINSWELYFAKPLQLDWKIDLAQLQDIVQKQTNSSKIVVLLDFMSRGYGDPLFEHSLPTTTGPMRIHDIAQVLLKVLQPEEVREEEEEKKKELASFSDATARTPVRNLITRLFLSAPRTTTVFDGILDALRTELSKMPVNSWRILADIGLNPLSGDVTPFSEFINTETNERIPLKFNSIAERLLDTLATQVNAELVGFYRDPKNISKRYPYQFTPDRLATLRYIADTPNDANVNKRIGNLQTSNLARQLLLST